MQFSRISFKIAVITRKEIESTMKRMIALILSLLLILVCLSSALAETAAEETAAEEPAAEEPAVAETTAEEAVQETTEEPAALPQQIAAGSFDEFLGEWKMTGIVYGGTFYNIEQMMANKFIAEDSDRLFTVTDDKKASLSYLGASMDFSCELNEATGVLMLKNDQTAGTLFLQDDGTMGMTEEGSEIIAVFAKVVKEEAAE